MQNSSRRGFLRNTSLAFGGLMLVSGKSKSVKEQKQVAVGCAPGKANFALTGTVSTVRSGRWSDPATWGGRVPSSNDTPLISSGHTVIYDQERATLAGVHVSVGATLQFDGEGSATLLSTKNVIIQGKLQMKPAAAAHVHTLRFIDIKERNFVGGGMTPLDSDVGLWVMGSGQLELVGSHKKAWTRTDHSVEAGATSFTATEALSGWAVGDELFVVPTEAPDRGEQPQWDELSGLGKGSFLSRFERRTVTAVKGNTVSWSGGLTYSHDKVVSDSGKAFAPEVGNLTRNVRLEGTRGGKTHLFIHSSAVHTLKNVALRHVGPRRDANGDGRPDMVAGRYGLHFHHCLFECRGTVVENCVVYDAGNHAFVPHGSHGITMKNNVAFNTVETAFWWDYQHLSHDTLWEGNLIAACYGLPRTLDTTDEAGDQNAGGAGVAMLLGMGDGNQANHNVVVYGGVGDEHGIGGFSWEANNEGVWVFENNVAHSNHCALRVWQNTSKNHTIINFESYNNYVGIFHGAYANSYSYRGGYHLNSLAEIKAASGSSCGVRFEQITFDGGGKLPYVVRILPSPIPSLENHDLFLKCGFKSYTGAAVRMDTFPISGETVRKHVDLALCSFSGQQAEFSGESSGGSFFRIQPVSGQSVQLAKPASASNISPFLAALWGSGTGLRGHYYNGSHFDSFAFSRIDSVIMFTQWRPDQVFSPTGVHYAIISEKYSVRWTGQLQAQYSEPYTFRIGGATGYRLWLDGRLVVDSWIEKAGSDDYRDSSVISLKEGQLYDIKLECFNTAFPTNCSLYWKSESMDMFRLVPQAQLYPGAASTNPPAPAYNQNPVANAGEDITITLPTNNTTLNGSASKDADGSIRAFRWIKISGPSQYRIEEPREAITALTGLMEGIYVFELTVTDNEDNVHTDNVVVRVNSDTEGKGQEPQPTLRVSASPNPTISETRITVKSTMSGQITVRIYDRSGNLIYTRGNLSNNSTFTVGDDAPSGTYIVEAIQGTLRNSITIIKK